MTTKLDIDELLGAEIKCQCGLYYRLVYSSAHYKTRQHILWEGYQKVPTIALTSSELDECIDVTGF
jgi:hypothetical protein